MWPSSAKFRQTQLEKHLPYPEWDEAWLAERFYPMTSGTRPFWPWNREQVCPPQMAGGAVESTSGSSTPAAAQLLHLGAFLWLWGQRTVWSPHGPESTKGVFCWIDALVAQICLSFKLKYFSDVLVKHCHYLAKPYGLWDNLRERGQREAKTSPREVELLTVDRDLMWCFTRGQIIWLCLLSWLLH